MGKTRLDFLRKAKMELYCIELLSGLGTFQTPDGVQEARVRVGWAMSESTFCLYRDTIEKDAATFSRADAERVAQLWRQIGYDAKVVAESDTICEIEVTEDGDED